MNSTVTHSSFALVQQHNPSLQRRMALPRVVARYALRILAMSLVTTNFVWGSSSAYTYEVVAQAGDTIGGVALSNIGSPFISNDGTVLFLGSAPNGTAMFSTNFLSNQQSIVVPPNASIGGYVLSALGGERQRWTDGTTTIPSAFVGIPNYVW
jgi:hypothetical protein